MLRGKYVAFVLMGSHFLRSPAFTVPESAQRWANQIRRENERSKNKTPVGMTGV